VIRADDATAENDITQGQLAEAIHKAIDVPCKSIAYEDVASS
jgi:hypothetical protein